MHVHIATVGTRPEVVFQIINYLGGIDRIHLLHTTETKKAALQIQDGIKFTHKDVSLVEVDEADFRGTVETIYQIAKGYGPNDRFTINVTGGTKIMSSAACFASYTIRAELYYSYLPRDAEGTPDPENARIIEFGTPVADNTSHYKPIKRRILKFIDAWEAGKIDGKDTRGVRLSNIDIAEEFKITKVAVGGHLKTLREDGLISIERDGRNNSIKLTEDGIMIVRHMRDRCDVCHDAYEP